MSRDSFFAQLLQRIEPSLAAKADASAAFVGVSQHLQSATTFKDRYVSTFLAGSYASDTAIRLRSPCDGTERPDIDVFVVTSFSMDDDPEAVLINLSRAVEADADYLVGRITDHSVRVLSSRSDMDIIPIIKAGSSYLMGCRKGRNWGLINPAEHVRWRAERDIAFGGGFKALVKLAKWWWQLNSSTARQMSFALEVLVALHASPGERSYEEAFAKLLENLRDAFARSYSAAPKPFVADPAIPSHDVLANVTLSQWNEFVQTAHRDAEIARQAQRERDHTRGRKLWAKLLSDSLVATRNPV